MILSIKSLEINIVKNYTISGLQLQLQFFLFLYIVLLLLFKYGSKVFFLQFLILINKLALQLNNTYKRNDMGWFSNWSKKGDQNSTQNTQQNKPIFSSYKSSSFSQTKRSCKIDPEDDKYMICKTITKDNNGTREEEQRLPTNASYKSSHQRENNFFRQGFGQSEQQKVFDKFPSFFIQPSFFDFHNSTPRASHQHDEQALQNDEHIKVFGNSSSTVCESDPQDDQYLICKTKYSDGKETKQIEQRIKASDGFNFSLGNDLFKMGNAIDGVLNGSFNMMLPFFSNMNNLFHTLDDPEQMEKFFFTHPNFTQKRNEASHKENSSKFSQKDNSKFFSNSDKKDTGIYDL